MVLAAAVAPPALLSCSASRAAVARSPALLTTQGVLAVPRPPQQQQAAE
eukprot:COSAG01_NODE_146_length_24099_cov_25.341208_2_plen_49_part_00